MVRPERRTLDATRYTGCPSDLRPELAQVDASGDDSDDSRDDAHNLSHDDDDETILDGGDHYICGRLMRPSRRAAVVVSPVTLCVSRCARPPIGARVVVC